MTFIPNTPTDNLLIKLVENNVFFPHISLNDYRARMRVDQVVPDSELEFIVKTSLLEVNSLLAAWQSEKMLEGFNTLIDLANDNINHWYLSAVYCDAKHRVIQQYRDYDSSHRGVDRHDEMSPRLLNLIADRDEAIAHIIGRKPVKVVLI